MFSKEPVRIHTVSSMIVSLNAYPLTQGNLRNLNSYKHSGLANTKVRRVVDYLHAERLG